VLALVDLALLPRPLFLLLEHAHFGACDAVIPRQVHEAVKVVLFEQAAVSLISTHSQAVDSDALSHPRQMSVTLELASVRG